MNAFNRVFTLIGLVLLTILGTATLIAPALMLNFIDTTAAFFQSSVLGGLSDAARLLVRIAAAIAFVPLMLTLVWLELGRPTSSALKVTTLSGGRIQITRRTLEEHLRQEIGALAGVLNVKAQVGARNDALLASLRVESAPGIDHTQLNDQIAAIVHGIIRDQYGVQLQGAPRITVKSARAVSKPLRPVQAAQPLALNAGSTDGAPSSTSSEGAGTKPNLL